MNLRTRINGKSETAIASDDRGLCYGDGLFETVWLYEGRAPLWPRHMARLADGCRRLQMPAPDPDRLWRDVQAVVANLDRAVVRITWTRGRGPRGYAPPRDQQPTCVVSAAELPLPSADWYHQGIRMHVCRTRLAMQPALAGLKHLNRLEQVLARNEWQDETVGEGLMLDLEDRVIGATAANIFAVRDGRLFTPALTRCGVAGTARAEILAECAGATVTDMSLSDLEQADELFLTSAVRGIVPVRELAGHVWPVGPCTRQLQARWQAAGLPPQVSA
ncbi:MAG TPA: aminodeoxychorismate lyase [Rhodanobacteraceae bacterium]|nr:aminodeoxychorismate lyase [Rhodanobacteraceae bacterium]